MHRAVSFDENPQCIIAIAGAIFALAVPRILMAGSVYFGVSATTIGVCAAAIFCLSALRTLAVTVTLTTASITRKTPFGEWRILWSEVERVEIAPGCTSLVLHGAGKRIWMARPLSSLESWSKSDADEDYEDPLVSIVLDTAEAHGAVFTNGWLTPFKLSRA